MSFSIPPFWALMGLIAFGSHFFLYALYAGIAILALKLAAFLYNKKPTKTFLFVKDICSSVNKFLSSRGVTIVCTALWTSLLVYMFVTSFGEPMLRDYVNLSFSFIFTIVKEKIRSRR